MVNSAKTDIIVPFVCHQQAYVFNFATIITTFNINDVTKFDYVQTVNLIETTLKTYRSKIIKTETV